MEKIKRSKGSKQRSGVGIFWRTFAFVVLCLILLAGGFLVAMWLSGAL